MSLICGKESLTFTALKWCEYVLKKRVPRSRYAAVLRLHVTFADYDYVMGVTVSQHLGARHRVFPLLGLLASSLEMTPKTSIFGAC